MYSRIELHCHTKMSRLRGLCDIHKLMNRAQEKGVLGIAVTDIDSVQAFPLLNRELNRLSRSYKSDPDNEGMSPFRIFYGMEVILTDQSEQEAYNSIVIAKNYNGVVALYELLTAALTDYSEGFPKIPKKLLEQDRADLIVGSCAEGGEIAKAILEGEADKALKQKISAYDFVEIEPPINMCYPIYGETLGITEDKAKGIITRITRLGRECKIPVIASSDVYYIEPSDIEAFKVLRYASGNRDLHSWKATHHLMDGEELMRAFAFLEKKDAKDVVYNNPYRLMEKIDTLKFPSYEKKYPSIPDAMKKIKKICKSKINEIYCSGIPDRVNERLNLELENIENSHFEAIYYIAYTLVKKSTEAGYPVGSRGSAGSSFVSYLLGITEMNPLPPHYYCKKCGYSDFDVYKIKTFHVGDVGIDLPDKVCPQCGRPLVKDGFDIPVESFLGLNFDKEPDFDLNFTEEYQGTAQEELGRIEGIGSTYYAGTIGFLSRHTAVSWANEYYRAKRSKRSRESISKVAEKLEDVKCSEGRHPGGVVVVPKGEAISSVSPVQNDEYGSLKRTHLEYWTMDEKFLKFDILRHFRTTMLKHLMDDTGIDMRSISLYDPKIMGLFNDGSDLGIRPEQIGGIDIGTLGIYEFSESEWLRKVVKTESPKSFSDIVRLLGFIHGTGVWDNNAEDLIKEGKNPYELISTRDDIFGYLISKGMDRKKAFMVMEAVRKGKARYSGLRSDLLFALKECSVPDWYIESCNKIMYLFPKAHCVAYAIQDWYLLYYKLYHPDCFYRRWLEFIAEYVDIRFVNKGYDNALKTFMDLKNRPSSKLSARQHGLLNEIPVVLEMYARNISL